jgi:DNA-binding protein YbaB
MTVPLNDPGSVIQGITKESKRLRERAEAMQTELAELREDVMSRDHVVTVTVGAGGIMRGINIEADGQAARPHEVAAAVMSAYGEGCRRVGEKAAEIVARFTPNSPLVTFMHDSVPPVAPDFDEGNQTAPVSSEPQRSAPRARNDGDDENYEDESIWGKR